MDLVELSIIGQTTKNIDFSLVDATSCLGSLHTELPQGKPLSILNTINLSLLQIAILFLIATDSKDHLTSLVVDQTVT